MEEQNTKTIYFNEYADIAGEQNFLNANQNYPLLKGTPTNLFKCFLPQGWAYVRDSAIVAYIHPEGVFNSTNGGILRRELYKMLRYHFQFINQLKLFDIGNTRIYSLNVYSNKVTGYFDSISDLYIPSTIDECYDSVNSVLAGIKSNSGNWNVKGHPSRIVRVGKNELKTFARIFSDSINWEEAQLPNLYISEFSEVLNAFIANVASVESSGVFWGTTMWPETGAQNAKIIERNVHFPLVTSESILSGPHIGVANPLYQTSQRVCETHRVFDLIDLTGIDAEYLQRCNYMPLMDYSSYCQKAPETPWGTSYAGEFKLFSRRRLNKEGERTLVSAIYPPGIGHVHTIIGVASKDVYLLSILAGEMASLIFDAYVRILGKDDIYYDTICKFPIVDARFFLDIASRSLLLNCVSSHYAVFWEKARKNEMSKCQWSKKEDRLPDSCFQSLADKWTPESPLRSDYARRQALIELDVLIAMALGFSLELLKTLYKILFPVLHQYEDDTWYDSNGRIVFSSKNMGELAYKRNEWNRSIKNIPVGKKCCRRRPGKAYHRIRCAL